MAHLKQRLLTEKQICGEGLYPRGRLRNHLNREFGEPKYSRVNTLEVWFPGSDFLITQIFPPHRDVLLGNAQGEHPSCPQLNVVQRLGARGKFTVTFQPQPDLNVEGKQIFSLEFPCQGLTPHNPLNLSVFLGQSQKRILRHLHSLMSKVLPVEITYPSLVSPGVQG